MGDTGAAHPLLMLAAALEEAKPGDRLLVIGYGNGCDALIFRVTDDIEKSRAGMARKGVKGYLARRRELNSYEKYAAFQGILPLDLGIRGEDIPPTAFSMLWREKKAVPKSWRADTKLHKFCPGCGHGLVLKALGQVIDELGLHDRVVFGCDIGCSLLSWDFFNVDSIQTHHSRTNPVMTGIKRANPGLICMAYMGDGGGYAIGSQHLVNAALRNDKITAIIVNNAQYGMTGGQMAPTTLPGMKTETSPYGRRRRVNRTACPGTRDGGRHYRGGRLCRSGHGSQAQPAQGFYQESLYIPNFGVEQRGGVSVAYVQIGNDAIGAPKFEIGDIVVALSERAIYRPRQ